MICTPISQLIGPLLARDKAAANIISIWEGYFIISATVCETQRTRNNHCLVHGDIIKHSLALIPTKSVFLFHFQSITALLIV